MDSLVVRAFAHAFILRARTFGVRVLVLALLGGASASAALAQSADLVVNQSDSPDPGPAGGVFTYTVRVDNNGPNAASNVVLTDTLPAGSTFLSATPTQGSCAPSPGAVGCNLGSIAFLGSATVTVTLRLPAAGVYTNRASASAATPDPNTANNIDITEDTTAQVAADMALAVVDAPDPVAAGQGYNYSVTATNHGPTALSATDQQTIDFALPAGACITGVSTSGSWACTPATGFPVCNGSISCTRSGALAIGASAPVLGFAAVATVAGTVTAAFQVSSTLADGNPADNTATAQTTVSGGSSDVSITQSATPSVVALGSNAVFTITPRYNAGEAPGTAAPNLITVTDTLAAGLTFVSATGTGWSCSTAPPVVTCTRPGPFAGAPFTNMPAIAVTATVGTTGPVTSTAAIAIPESDPVPNNNSATSTVTGSNSADLQVTKTATVNPVVPGQIYAYTITVRNIGPVGATAANTITLTDTLDANTLLWAMPAGTGWTCTPNAGFPIASPVTVTCTRPGPLASATNAPAISIPVRAIAAAATSNTACAALSGSGPSDGNSANDCGTVNVPATVTQADLVVSTHTVSPNPVFAGQNLTYTVTVTNNGPDDATNVVFTDTLASLVTTGGFQSAASSQGSCTPAGVTAGPSVNLSCNLGTLAAGADATITIVVRPTTATTASRTNTATVSSADVGDPVRGNNASAVTSTVTAVADVQVTLSATPNPVRSGTPLTYVVTARNNGPSTAQSVTINDALPANAAFVQIGAVTGGGACTTPAVGTQGGTLSCTWASLGSGTQQTVTFAVRPLTSAAGGTVDDSVVISTATADATPGNDTTSTSTPVTTAQLDVLVNKVDSVDPVALGQSTTYTVTVTNAGPSYGTNVQMVDNFPSGSPTATFSYQGNLAIAPAGIGTCSEPAVGATSGTIVCTFPGLASGQSAVVTYDMRAEDIASGLSGTTFNTASVTVNEPDALAGNNTSTNATTTRRTADLAVTKSGPASAVPGTTFDYVLHVANAGPNDSVGASVFDTLPAGIAFVSATAGCTNASGTVTCAVGTLANGASADFTITVQVSSPYTGATPLVNSATVATVNEVDPNPANDTGTSTTTVGAPVADLSIVKAGPASVQPGGALVYTLTIANGGPSAADGATFQDSMPAGVLAVGATCGSASGGAACGTVSASNASVTGTVPVLPVGASVVITVSAAAPAAGPLLNHATVAPPPNTTDPALANNASDVSTAVAPVDLAITKTHTGVFTAGGMGTWTIVVANVGSAPSSGAVTVSDTLPAGMTATALSGPGWACTLVPLVCSRSDSLPNATSFPTITLTIAIGGATSGTLTNAASVSGGNDSNAANNTATDAVTVVQVPDLAIAKTHSGTLRQGQQGVSYTIMVSNAGAGSTTGVVTVTEMPGDGLTVVGLSGTGWSCVVASATCTRADVLATASSFPPITAVVNLAADAPATITNHATVSTAGDTVAANDAVDDVASVQPVTPAQPVPATGLFALLAMVGVICVLAPQFFTARARRR